jgi:protein SCO1/2
MNRFAHRGLLTFCLLAVGIGQALAHSADEHGGHDMQAKSATPESTQVKFADVALVDQNGKTVRLEKDLVSNKIVVMSFIYTSCTTVCPVVSSIMGKVQQQLGARVGTEVQLVSISIDPQRDDAKRLNDYARPSRTAGLELADRHHAVGQRNPQGPWHLQRRLQEPCR